MEGELFDHKEVLPDYEIPLATVKDLSEKLIDYSRDRVPLPYRFIAVEVEGTSPYANIGRYIERTVFESSFGNNASEMSQEYGPYEKASRFYLSLDRENQVPTGVLRIIQNSSAGLKSWDDAVKYFNVDIHKAQALEGLEVFEKVWDVGTIAVLPEYRRNTGPVSILLERALYLSAMANDIRGILSIVDDKPLIKMRSTWRGVGIPFQNLPGTSGQPYLGSKKSFAVYGHIPDFYEKMSNHKNSFRGKMIARYILGDALERLVEGRADDAIILRDTYKNQTA